MRYGIHLYIPPLAVRLTVGVLAAAAVALAVTQAPDAWRYVKIETM
ncbi:DUF6893 family small protein [Peterkaempfera griseoplana]|nr:hypothetical protein [Peterkaempfera griseoplana]